MSSAQTLNYIFNAAEHEPDVGIEAVPADTYDFDISAVQIKDMRDDKGQYLAITFDIASGQYKGRKVTNNYNLWHKISPEAVAIAHAQLSALSHVTGVFTIDFNNGGAALLHARGKMRVDNDGKFNSVKEVLDVNGNKANRAGRGAQQPLTAPVAVATPATNWGTGGVANAPAPQAPVAPTIVAAPTVEDAEALAKRHNVQHYPGHRYDPATNAYVVDAPAAPVSPFAGTQSIPAAPQAPAAPQWTQAPVAAAPAANTAPWGAR
jgi:hypothetical protein